MTYMKNEQKMFFKISFKRVFKDFFISMNSQSHDIFILKISPHLQAEKSTWTLTGDTKHGQVNIYIA